LVASQDGIDAPVALLIVRAMGGSEPRAWMWARSLTALIDIYNGEIQWWRCTRRRAAGHLHGYWRLSGSMQLSASHNAGCGIGWPRRAPDIEQLNNRFNMGYSSQNERVIILLLSADR
jgi:hypothetical protein